MHMHGRVRVQDAEGHLAAELQRTAGALKDAQGSLAEALERVERQSASQAGLQLQVSSILCSHNSQFMAKFLVLA